MNDWPSSCSLISVGMLADVGCQYSLVGHSERRTLFGETNEGCQKKVAALFGVTPRKEQPGQIDQGDGAAPHLRCLETTDPDPDVKEIAQQDQPIAASGVDRVELLDQRRRRSAGATQVCVCDYGNGHPMRRAPIQAVLPRRWGRRYTRVPP